jgi:hypothetical protein
MKPSQIFSLALCSLMVLGASDAVIGQSQSRKAMKKQRQLTLGPVVNAARQVSMDEVDHSSWNTLLQKYVDESGGVNYAGLQASAEDSAALDNYIATLSTASLNKKATSNNQKAFWINAYNAVTVKGILQEYPTTSIRNHTSETGGYNLWKNLLLNVGGAQISLDSIEHKELRPMGDPRIHFAIVCASEGCPRLLNQAYVGETLDAQLNTNAQHFFSLAQNFQHDARTRSFKLSAIMKWFGTDFGQNQAAQLKAIAPYLPTKEAQAAANANSVRVSHLEYSWKLNEQSKAMAGGQIGSQIKSSQTKGSQSKQNAGSQKK